MHHPIDRIIQSTGWYDIELNGSTMKDRSMSERSYPITRYPIYVCVLVCVRVCVREYMLTYIPKPTRCHAMPTTKNNNNNNNNNSNDTMKVSLGMI